MHAGRQPYTFERVVEDLEREGKKHGPRVLIKLPKEGKALIESASADPTDDRNQCVLIEVHGRLWFRPKL